VPVLSAFQANSEDPNIKHFPGEHAPGPPKRFDQVLVFAFLLDVTFSLHHFFQRQHNYLVLVRFRLSGFSFHHFFCNFAVLVQNCAQNPVFVHFDIKHFARHEFCILFASFKLN